MSNSKVVIRPVENARAILKFKDLVPGDFFRFLGDSDLRFKSSEESCFNFQADRWGTPMANVDVIVVDVTIVEEN